MENRMREYQNHNLPRQKLQDDSLDTLSSSRIFLGSLKASAIYLYKTHVSVKISGSIGYIWRIIFLKKFFYLLCMASSGKNFILVVHELDGGKCKCFANCDWKGINLRGCHNMQSTQPEGWTIHLSHETSYIDTWASQKKYASRQ